MIGFANSFDWKALEHRYAVAAYRSGAYEVAFPGQIALAAVVEEATRPAPSAHPAKARGALEQEPPKTGPVATLLRRLRARGREPHRHADGWMALCPGHSDTRPSLSIRLGSDGATVLVKCFAGCKARTIVEALGLRMGDLFPPREGDARSGPSNGKGGDAPAWGDLAERFNLAAADRLPELAASLGVSVAALADLRTGWAEAEELEEIVGRRVRGAAWVFPMVAPDGRVTGLSARSAADGSKWVVRGSRLGLFIPTSFHTRSDTALVPEGPTCTAAALSRDFLAVGRPGARAGVEMLAELFRKRACVVIGENDGTQATSQCPGRAAAIDVAAQLTKRLGRPIRYALPPARHKDFRAWHLAGDPIKDPSSGNEGVGA